MSATQASQRGADKLLPGKLEKSLLWRIKLRLQFTGWLQFIPPLLVALLCWMIAGVAWLIAGGPSWFFWIPSSVGSALVAVVMFDVATVRLGLHPAEPIPAATDLNAFDLMRSRRSCRSFQARNLTQEHRAQLLTAVERYTQSEQLLGDSPIRLEYVAAPLTVWPTIGAHEFLVAIAPSKYDRTAVIDVGRSLQKVVLQATRMGVATCWIGPGADQRSVAKHLGDRFNPNEDHIICVCAIGYASRFLPLMIRLMQVFQHRRLTLSSLFFRDEWTTPLDVETPPFAAFGRCYEVCQWSPSSYNSQTTRCVAVTDTVGGGSHVQRFDFFCATRSRYYAPVALGIWCANWETGCEALGQAGHFAVLSPEQRGMSASSDVPRYDVSWVVSGEC